MIRNIDYEKLGKRIRDKRMEKDLKQEQLAEKVNITPQHMSNIEANNADSIGLKTLMAIANTLDSSLEYLLADSIENNEDLTNKEIESMVNKMTQQQRLFAMDAIKIILDNKDKFK